MSELIDEFQDVGIISLSDDDLSDDSEQSLNYIAGLFQSSKDCMIIGNKNKDEV